MDVSGLYTSIPHDGALEASKHSLNKLNNKSISASAQRQIIELVLKLNTFHFNGRYFSKKEGVSMGRKM